MKIHLKTIVVVGLLALLIPVLLGYVATTGAVSSNTTADHANSKNINNSQCNGCHAYLSYVQTGAGGESNAHRRHFLTVFLNFANNYYVTDPVNDTSYGCARCHQETALGYEGDISYIGNSETSPTTVTVASNPARKLVSSDFCERCHGQFNLFSLTSTPTAHSLVATESGGKIKITSNTCVATGACHISVGTGKSGALAHGSGPFSSTTSTADNTSSIWWVDQRYANADSNCARCHGALAWFQTTETNPGP